MLDINNCCGCSACYNICPQKSIEMKPDKYGFLTPVINNDTCVNCGLCEKVCPMLNHDSLNRKLGDLCYIGQLKNQDELKLSQSGGAFWALAKGIIAKNGVVYGCGYKDSLTAAHKRAETISSCQEFRRSKYVQSDAGDVFSKVKADLKCDRLVLFSGTPCQCHGLKMYLQKDYDNLIICDIVCHGVPSPKITQKYLSEIEKKENAKAVDLAYRYYDGEQDQWGSHNECITLSNGKKVFGDVLSKLFYSHAFMRTSCYECPFCSTVQSDITVADAWGLPDFHPDYKNSQYGVSEMIIHTQKHRDFIENLLFDEMNLTKVSYDDIANEKYQPHLHRPVTPHAETKRLWDIFLKNGAFSSYQYLVKMKKIQRYKNFLLRISKKIFSKK